MSGFSRVSSAPFVSSLACAFVPGIFYCITTQVLVLLFMWPEFSSLRVFLLLSIGSCFGYFSPSTSGRGAFLHFLFSEREKDRRKKFA